MTVLRFSGFTLDTVNRELRRGATRVPAEPKVLECVELLVRRAGQLVTTEELRQALWPDVKVGGDAMRQVIYGARKALGDSGTSPALIRNRKRLGYVFAGEVAREAPRRVWPFVGREEELQRLLGALASARDGRGAVCLVAGEAGAGKSALLSRLREAAGGDAACSVGQCQPGSGVPAFWPFREMARADPAFPDASALTEAGGTRDAEHRFLACDGFVRRLVSLSRSRPLLLILEDLHWADDGTLLLFEWLARAARDSAIAVVGTYRPEDVTDGTSLAKALGRVSGREGAVDVTLPSLTVDELLALLAELSHPAGTRRGAEALREMTGGNALFVRQVVQQTAAQGGSLPGVLSGGLRHVVLERAARLPAETQRMLGMASVLGREFSVAMVGAIAGAAPEDVLRAAQPAIVTGILELSGGEVRFSHALLRDALYDALSPADRRAHHARALSAWMESPPGAVRTAAMATHAFQARDAVPKERRLEWCEQAGREAFEALAFDHAAIHFERALELANTVAPTEATAELALLAARALWEADAASEATARAFHRAAALARLSRSPHVLAHAAIGCAVGEESVATLSSARWKPENLSLLEEALAAMEQEPPSPSRALILRKLARALSAVRSAAGDVAGAYAAAGVLLSSAPEDEEPWARVQHLFLSFTNGLWLAGSDGGDGVVPALAAHAADPGLRAWQRVESCAMRLSAALLRGDAHAYRDAGDDMERLLATLPQPPFGRSGDRYAIYRGVRELASVTAAIFEGRMPDAERMLHESAARRERPGAPVPREIQEAAFLLRLQLLGYLGRAATLESEVDRRLREYPDDAWHLSIAKAQVLLERRAVDEAITYYDVVRNTGFCVPYSGRLTRAKPETRWRMVELCVALGDDADAAVLFDARGRGAHYFIADGVFVGLGSSSRPMGELAEKLGRHEDAEALFRQALEMNGRMGHRPEVIHSALCLARELQRRGRHREARPHIARSRAEAAELGLSPMIALAETLAARSSA